MGTGCAETDGRRGERRGRKATSERERRYEVLTWASWRAHVLRVRALSTARLYQHVRALWPRPFPDPSLPRLRSGLPWPVLTVLWHPAPDVLPPRPPCFSPSSSTHIPSLPTSLTAIPPRPGRPLPASMLALVLSLNDRNCARRAAPRTRTGKTTPTWPPARLAHTCCEAPSPAGVLCGAGCAQDFYSGQAAGDGGVAGEEGS